VPGVLADQVCQGRVVQIGGLHWRDAAVLGALEAQRSFFLRGHTRTWKDGPYRSASSRNLDRQRTLDLIQQVEWIAFMIGNC